MLLSSIKRGAAAQIIITIHKTYKGSFQDREPVGRDVASNSSH